MDGSEKHPAAAFVHAFHADLSHWFAGTDEQQAVLSRLKARTPGDMVLVYPSGQRLRGRDFFESIAELYGQSPGFMASISELQVVVAGEGHAVVCYVETQTGARQSAAQNRRSALAVVERNGDEWRWRFIHETALAD